jgi:hypothetical protein
MAVLALAVAGAALAPVGYAAIGWTIGTVVGQMLFPGSLPDQQGPRVGDLRAQQSQYGAAIPILYGTTRVAGNVIWSTDLIERSTTTSVGGGKGGGPEQSQTTYSYSVSMAILIGAGPVTGIRRIWADGKLVYNVGAGASDATVFASNQLAPGIAFYRGTETQQPDPTMQAYLGAATVPAYRGLAYLVLTDFQLADYGNRRPNITVEIVAAGSIVSTQQYVTPPPVDANTAYLDIATDGNVLIALDQQAPMRTIRSTDGVAWSGVRTVTGGGAGRCIEWFDGVWTILSTTGLAWSRDGLSWTYVSGAIDAGTSVAWNGEIRVAIGNGATWAYSYDGITWTSMPVPTFATWRNVVWSGVHFVAVAFTGATAISRDGRVWEVGSIAAIGTTWSRLASSGQHLLAVQSGNPQAARSTDHGVSWSTVTMPTSRTDWVVWGGRYYVAVTGLTSPPGVTAYSRSADGITWEQFAQSTAVSLQVVINRSGVFYALNITGVPNQRFVSIRFDTVEPTPVALSVVVSDICARAGLAAGDVDVSALSDLVDGYSIGQQMPARAALEALQRAYFFDGIESGGKIVFRKRGAAPVAAIAADDLAAAAAGDSLPDDLSIVRQQEVELPAVVSVVYIDKDTDYEQSTQQSARSTTLSTQQSAVELAISLSANRARAIADTLLFDAWTQRQRYTFTTSRAYAALEPADVVTLSRAGTTHTLRIERKTESRSGVIQWEAAAEEPSVYTQSATGGAGEARSGVVAAPPVTAFWPLDIPLLRDTDDGQAFYAAAAGFGAGWRGAVVYRSSDSGATYAELAGITGAASAGFALTALPAAANPHMFDEASTVDVELYSGALVSATELAVLNGNNAMLIGSEVLQFKVATLIGTNQYRLSGLLRGRRGTENQMGTHVVAERAIALTANALALLSGSLNAVLLLKPVSIGRTMQETTAQPFTYTGVNLDPFSPVDLQAGRDAANTITIAWRRRSRLGASLPLFYDPVLGEATEAYEVEIWNATFTTLRRTITGLSAATTTYSVAQQTADTGGVLSSYGVRVFQMSAVVGRGFALQGVI